MNVRRHHHAPGNESKVDISFYFNWRRRKMGIPPSALRCSFSLILHPFPIFIYRCMYIYIYYTFLYSVYIIGHVPLINNNPIRAPYKCLAFLFLSFVLFLPLKCSHSFLYVTRNRWRLFRCVTEMTISLSASRDRKEFQIKRAQLSIVSTDQKPSVQTSNNSNFHVVVICRE